MCFHSWSWLWIRVSWISSCTLWCSNSSLSNGTCMAGKPLSKSNLCKDTKRKTNRKKSDLNVFLYRLGAWILLLLNFLFIVSWTTVAISVSVSPEEGDRYVLPQVRPISVSVSFSMFYLCSTTWVKHCLTSSVHMISETHLLFVGLVACVVGSFGTGVDGDWGVQGSDGDCAVTQKTQALAALGCAESQWGSELLSPNVAWGDTLSPFIYATETIMSSDNLI